MFTYQIPGWMKSPTFRSRPASVTFPLLITDAALSSSIIPDVLIDERITFSVVRSVPSNRIAKYAAVAGVVEFFDTVDPDEMEVPNLVMLMNALAAFSAAGVFHP